jgi:RNA polymerase sigma-B factor
MAVPGVRYEASQQDHPTGDGDVMDLHRRYRRTRDPELRDVLVGRHADLVRRLAARFDHRGEELEDLVQVGFWGLLKAIDRFDPDRRVRFATFATPTIIGELKRHFRKRWNLRVPRGVQENYLRVRETSQMLFQDLGRSPSVDDIASCTGLGAAEVLEAMGAGATFRPLSLNEVFEQEHMRGEGVLAGSFPGPESAEDRCQLASLLSSLPSRDRKILWLRFGHELRQHEIAAELGISQMQVSRLLARSLDKLRTLVA